MSATSSWSPDDAGTARACIGAALYGPFLLDGGSPDALDWEFSTRVGFEWLDAKRLATEWDGRSEPEGSLRRLIRSLANTLDGYPHGKHAELASAWGLDPSRLRTLIERLRDTPLIS